MNKEKFYRENEKYLKMLALHYSRNCFIKFDDLFQEGALGMLVAFNNYSKKKKDAELKKIGKTVANRFMFNYVGKEIKKEEFATVSGKSAEEAFNRNMKKLSEKEREVIEKLYLEGKTIYAISKGLKISRSTVRYRKHIAIEHLKREILNDIGNLGIMLSLRGW